MNRVFRVAMLAMIVAGLVVVLNLVLMALRLGWI